MTGRSLRPLRPILVAVVMLALPWLWTAWLTRPGVPRPPVTDVVLPFAILPPLAAGRMVERAAELRRPALAATGIGLSLLSLALLALRLHDAFLLFVLGGVTLFVALATFGIHRIFASRRPEQGEI